MALSDDPTDPRHLTPSQRLDEITALLAAGARRALAARAAPGPAPDSLESAGSGLDVSAETRLHVHHG